MSKVTDLLGEETDSFKIVAGYIGTYHGLVGTYEGEEPKAAPPKLIIILLPKIMTFEDGVINDVTGKPTPDNLVRIEGRPEAVLLALEELLKKKETKDGE